MTEQRKSLAAQTMKMAATVQNTPLWRQIALFLVGLGGGIALVRWFVSHTHPEDQGHETHLLIGWGAALAVCVFLMAPVWTAKVLQWAVAKWQDRKAKKGT